MYSVDIYSRVRRACLKDGMSAREAARIFNKDRKTIAKMLRHELPPGYRRSEAPRRPTLDGYVGIIDEILRTGPVAELCRSFTRILCAKGERLWERNAQQNLDRKRSGSH